MPDEAAEVKSLLEQLRGADVDLRVPQRGDKRSLMETVEEGSEFELHIRYGGSPRS